jgi:Tfp pilus assembly protein PilE
MVNDIKIVISIFIIIVLGIIAFFGYNKIYNRGYEQAHLECVEARQKYEQELQEKITNLETSLITTQKLATTKQQKLSKQIQEISSKLKTEPIVIVKNGECLPSPSFVDSISEAIMRANQK